MKAEYEYNKAKIRVETVQGTNGEWRYQAQIQDSSGIYGVDVGEIPVPEFATEAEAMNAGKAKAQYRVDNRYVKPITSN